MVFFAGVLAGGVVGLGVGIMLQRRAGDSNLMTARGFTTIIAMVALVVAAVALAKSGDHHDRASDASGAQGPGPAVSSTTTAPTTTSNGTTGTTQLTGQETGLVAVPNVEHLARTQAVNILQNAGLKVTIEPLPLSNVPAGFVISQNPLPGAMTAAGTTVTLVVSAPA